jgi:hypothetical protein
MKRGSGSSVPATISLSLCGTSVDRRVQHTSCRAISKWCSNPEITRVYLYLIGDALIEEEMSIIDVQ